ncbi:MAG TPA: FecR domain-containing protein [Enhygromyxa sp.]|nr:FecR domain-containing protein [Enhygromyxa sp.]
MGKVSPGGQVHYGCQEFRDDSERIIQGRGHPQLEHLYHGHLAVCGDCQRYHHRLEAIYRKPRKIAPLDSFARDREFAAILARRRPVEQGRAQTRRWVASGSVGVLSAIAAVLILALAIPSFGARLFGPPAAAQLELRSEVGFTSYGDSVQIPVRPTLGHQAQTFARVIGGAAVMTDADGRVSGGDSLTVGTTVVAGAEPVQIAFVGRLLANFQPDTIARWHSATPNLLEIGLLSGTLAVRYDRSHGDPILQVRTPNVLVRVVGTVFTVAVDSHGETTVSVLRGKVDVLDVRTGRSLAAVEAGFRFDSSDSSYRELGRREVAAALPLREQLDLRVSIDKHGELTYEESTREPGQIPTSWTVPGLSDDPAERTLDRVRDPDATAPLQPARPKVASSSPASNRGNASKRRSDGEEATRRLINSYARVERERKAAVESQLERCRALEAEPETRFRAARCLGDFMRDYGDQPEAVEGLLMLGTLRMDFAHDYQSATRNFEEFLRRAPEHPKAELARYKLVLAAIEAGYIDRAIQRARAYLHQYPDGEYVGRVLQRFPELKSEL